MTDFFRVPEGMTHDEVLDTVIKVVDKIAHKYTFFGFDLEDIKQESFFICRDGLTRYDPSSGPLENFLSVHLPYRLINFIRKMSMSKGGNEEKQKIYKPAQLDEGFNRNTDEEYDCESIDYADMISIINRELPANMRQDWLKMANEAPVSKARRTEITGMVKYILEEHGYETMAAIEEQTSEKR